MKYGSGGFNSYGYQAGCAFVNGTQEEAQADPAAARYLCTREQVGTKQCFHDFSGEGVCLAELLLGYDDFYSVGSVRPLLPTPAFACIGYQTMRQTLLQPRSARECSFRFGTLVTPVASRVWYRVAMSR